MLNRLTAKGSRAVRPVLFIPNSIKSDFYIKRNKNKIVNILSVGRFHMQKDYKTAIAVINNLKSSSLKFSYTIVGYGELENEIKSYINKYDLNKIVRLKIKPKNLHEIYKSSDIFFQTSLYEGISNSQSGSKISIFFNAAAQQTG